MQVIGFMELAEVLEQGKEQYNNFVASREAGSFLQAYEWGEWQTALGRTVVRYKILDNSGLQVASVQLVKMPLPFGRYYLYAPYGPVLDFRFKIEDLRFLIQELKSKFPEAIFIRIEPKVLPLTANSSPLVKSANIQPAKTLLVDLAKSEDVLLAEMHHKTRYNIKPEALASFIACQCSK